MNVQEAFDRGTDRWGKQPERKAFYIDLNFDKACILGVIAIGLDASLIETRTDHIKISPYSQALYAIEKGFGLPQGTRDAWRTVTDPKGELITIESAFDHEVYDVPTLLGMLQENVDKYSEAKK